MTALSYRDPNGNNLADIAVQVGNVSAFTKLRLGGL
jgi:hypothetical protein